MPVTPNQAATFSVALKIGGNPVVLDQTAVVTGTLYSADGQTALSPARAANYNAIGANWGAGLVVIDFLASDTAGLTPPQNRLIVNVAENGASRSFAIDFAVSGGAAVKSALFVKSDIVPKIRADKLIALCQNYAPGVTLSDDSIWAAVVAAEKDAQHRLRVFLQPTYQFPYDPTDAEVAALNGMPYNVDPPYDYDPEFFRDNRWGMLQTRQKPIVRIDSVQFAYPYPNQPVFQFPADWIRPDKKYGHIRFVPTSTQSFAAPLTAYVLQALGGGRVIPHMLEVRYVAGLANAAADYPDLIDLVLKMAVLRLIDGLFLPQSASVSADGLSQNYSVDASKYKDMIDAKIGTLMDEIHGVRFTIA